MMLVLLMSTKDIEKEEFDKLEGRYKHFCPDWDLMAIDEYCPEFDSCQCYVRLGSL